MLDAVFGFLLVSLGLRPVHPAVLGEASVSVKYVTPAASSSFSVTSTPGTRPTLRVLRPVLTKDQEDAFQKERKAREKTVASVSSARTNELRSQFQKALRVRVANRQAVQSELQMRIRSFSDKQKQQILLTVADRYQSAAENSLDTMQQKLTAMLTLLDKISVSAAALEDQGKDVAAIDSSITAAQAKITTALTLATNLIDTIPMTLTVTGEDTAKQDVIQSVSTLRMSLAPLSSAYQDARTAVHNALMGVKMYTQPVEETAGQ